MNTTNKASLAQLLSASGGFNNNPAALVGFILGSVGEAILLAPGLFSGGGASGSDGGAAVGGGDSTGGDDSGDDSGDSASAFDSGCVYMPDADSQTDPNASANGVLLSVNSDSDGSDAASGVDGSAEALPDDNSTQQIGHTAAAAGSGDGGADVSPTVYDGPTVYDASSTKIDAVPQVGRYLNVINLSGTPATIYIQYHAQDQNGNWNWFPANPDRSQDALSFDLKSRQAAEVWDGKWQVYADKARVWAVSADGTQQWNRYKDTDLLLVSETDDQGQPCYYSPNIQTLSFGLK